MEMMRDIEAISLWCCGCPAANSGGGKSDV